MRTLLGISAAFFLGSAIAMRAAGVDPIPEPRQAAAALKILREYRGTTPAAAARKLHVVYFTPSDRDPEPRYRERLDAIIEDIRSFYRDGMEKAGFGATTFDAARDPQGRLILHVVKGHDPDSAYARSGFLQNGDNDSISRQKIVADCQAALKAAGLSFEEETVLIFCNLARWDESAKTFRHHSPYAGWATQKGGWCFAVDSVILDLALLEKKQPVLQDAEWGPESIGKFNTIFIGGIAHELGHAFALPHGGERPEERVRGTSLMGLGNHTYREERRGEGTGTFLTMASALKLAARPLFSRSEKEVARAPRVEKSELELSTRGSRSGVLRIDGTVLGTPPVYGVIAYFDCAHNAYIAPTATGVPDADGRFALEISDLPASSDAELRIEYCHANGAVSESRFPFEVEKEGRVNLDRWKLTRVLNPLIEAVIHENLPDAKRELVKIENGNEVRLAKLIGTRLVAGLEKTEKPIPANAPAELAELLLGDARAESAEVGWFAPAFNRVPPNAEVPSPLLDAGRIYATGLYAHAPSRYVYRLGGQWKMLRGEAGLHAAKSFGSVVFVIKSDGREVFRSPVIRESEKARYQIDVKGVKTLELLVENGGDGNAGDWGLWLDPTLTR